MPLKMFRIHNLKTANIIGVLWAAAMFAWFFMSALYLQVILGYNPLQVGLSFLPTNLIMGAFSIGLSAKVVMKFGTKKPLIVGMILASTSLALFAIAPADGTFLLNVFPSMILLGIGGGMAFNPLMLSAMSDVSPKDSGLASGMVNTAFMMGGALGLAVLASLAAYQTENLISAGATQSAALLSGYHAAFLVGALFALTAALLAALRLKPVSTNQEAPPTHL